MQRGFFSSGHSQKTRGHDGLTHKNTNAGVGFPHKALRHYATSPCAHFAAHASRLPLHLRKQYYASRNIAPAFVFLCKKKDIQKNAHFCGLDIQQFLAICPTAPPPPPAAAPPCLASAPPPLAAGVLGLHSLFVGAWILLPDCLK